MIISVKCDKPSFKTVTFKPGFNIILADRTDRAKPKDSRNALGKSLLIEIIHFCLGSSIKENVALGMKELFDWTFTLEIVLRGKEYALSRNTKDRGKILIRGDFSGWPIKPEIDEATGSYYFKIKEWTVLLGYLLFNLSAELSTKKYTPTFRSLFSYFCRRDINGGYLSPFKHYSQQKEWDIQVNNTYLLNLNWGNASEWQVIKDKEKLLQDLKEAAKQGLLKDLIGNIGELEAYRINLLEEIGSGDESLKSFKVLPEYHKVQEETNMLTEQIHDLCNQNNIANQILKKYNENITEEENVSIEDMKKVYNEAEIIFSDRIIRRIDDVIKFTKDVIRNRKEYLFTELKRLETEINVREKKITDLSQKRTECMGILSTHGALEEYSKLQERQTGLINQLKDIESRIETLHKFEEGKSTLRIEREHLLVNSRRDLQAREEQKARAIKFFNDHSQYLYAEAGIFSINLKDSGYKLDVEMKRSGSHGIEKMKIFCYDLTLMKLRSDNKDMPGFLIHDSVMFDGVDERQRAKALELAKTEAERYGFQYICTMNSDMIPEKDLSADFDIDKYVRIRFTDATDGGGLLGIRF